MTIRPGSPWGAVVDRPSGAIQVDSDAALAGAIAADRASDGETTRAAVVTGGDLYRTVGGASPGQVVRRYPIDVMDVRIDGREVLGVAHVVARSGGPLGWWRGPLLAVMNVGRLGAWDVAPRAHPNDGRLDTVDVAAAMTMRERWQARRRLPSGVHVPHPRIALARPTTLSRRFDRPTQVWVDGVAHGSVSSLSVTIQPDGATVYT